MRTMIVLRLRYMNVCFVPTVPFLSVLLSFFPPDAILSLSQPEVQKAQQESVSLIIDRLTMVCLLFVSEFNGSI